MIEPELINSRLAHFKTLGYFEYTSETPKHPLQVAALVSACKVLSMLKGLSFPTANAKAISGTEIPEVYLTELGYKTFVKGVSIMSPELFEMVLPIFKGQFTPSNFEISNPRILQNMRGEVGASARKTPKPPLKIHILADNTYPYEYLQSEYIFDSMYEARTFLNKLLAYVPTERLELWRVRTSVKTGKVTKDREPLIISRRPHKMDKR